MSPRIYRQSQAEMQVILTCNMKTTTETTLLITVKETGGLIAIKLIISLQKIKIYKYATWINKV